MVQVSLSQQRDDVVTSTTPTTPSSDALPIDARWRRYDRYAGIIVATIVAMVILATISGDGASTASGRLGGDYPAFYGAGSIVLDGDIADLYDADRQASAQSELLEEGDFLFFAYPPPVAVAYAPLAALPYRISYLVHTLLMLAALIGAIWLLRPVVPAVDRFPGISTAVALTFYPMLRAVTGGQNTALTVFLIVLTLRLVGDDRRILAGVAAALLLYKPQFGIPIAALLFVPPRWEMIRGWAGGAAGFFAVGAIASGPGWVADWWSEATSFAEINEGVNGFLFVSIPGMIANWFGSQDGAGRALWVLAVVLSVAGAVLVWRRFDDPLRRWSLTALAVVLVLPQALYYEAGIALLGIAALGVSGVALGVIWLLSWTQIGADALSWSPLGIVTPTILVWLLWRAHTEGISST
jgi:hypothetical protein